MPDIPGTLKPPRLASAPGSPVLGQMYVNTATNTLYWWSGTAWIPASAEVHIGTAAPSPRVNQTLWVDTT